MELDALVRQAAFEFLDALVKRHGDLLPRAELQRGFEFRGRRVPLLGPEGIFKPAALPELPLSITTAPPREGREPRYRDELSGDGFLQYRYRGTDPRHPDNAGLRNCMERGTPLVYFHGVVPGRYLAQWPVRIVRDDPASLTFHVSLEDGAVVSQFPESIAESADSPVRAYRTIEIQQRIHQRSFRERVLLAYGRICAICRLRHEELLDAAHIIPDTDPRGVPTVPNGISLCKLHHAAFDEKVVGIRPDFLIEVRKDVMEEEDGPMLEHGLQHFHGERIQVPRVRAHQPNRAFLEERFDLFLKAS